MEDQLTYSAMLISLLLFIFQTARAYTGIGYVYPVNEIQISAEKLSFPMNLRLKIFFDLDVHISPLNSCLLQPGLGFKFNPRSAKFYFFLVTLVQPDFR
jgi:hypothetical protein